VRIGACQTREILGDVDAAVTVIQDFADRAAHNARDGVGREREQAKRDSGSRDHRHMGTTESLNSNVAHACPLRRDADHTKIRHCRGSFWHGRESNLISAHPDAGTRDPVTVRDERVAAKEYVRRMPCPRVREALIE
jgi:hypothetical protein